MRTALNLPRTSRRPRKPKTPQLHCAEAQRSCELAAVRVKCASDELTAHWVALSQEAAEGAELSELVRARSWCQVLEARLKERLCALNHAREALEEAWRQSAVEQGLPWPVSEVLTSELAFDAENPTWTLLAKSAAHPGGLSAAHRNGK